MSKQTHLIRAEDISNVEKKRAYESANERRYTIHLIQHSIAITYICPVDKNMLTLANLKQFVLPLFQQFSNTNEEDIIFSKNNVDIAGNNYIDVRNLGVFSKDHLHARNMLNVEITVLIATTSAIHNISIHPHKTIMDLKLKLSVEVRKPVSQLIIVLDDTVLPNGSFISMWNITDAAVFHLHYQN